MVTLMEMPELSWYNVDVGMKNITEASNTLTRRLSGLLCPSERAWMLLRIKVMKDAWLGTNSIIEKALRCLSPKSRTGLMGKML